MKNDNLHPHNNKINSSVNYVFFDDPELKWESIKIIKKFQNKSKEILELEKENKELEMQANHDPLTWLLNRRWIEKKIEENYESWELVHLISIDIKWFKQINENYWHSEGDKALEFLSEILKDNFRYNEREKKEDLIARWWWDEFIIILKKDFKENNIKERINIIENKLKKTQTKLPFNINLHYELGTMKKIKDYRSIICKLLNSAKNKDKKIEYAI